MSTVTQSRPTEPRPIDTANMEAPASQRVLPVENGKKKMLRWSLGVIVAISTVALAFKFPSVVGNGSRESAVTATVRRATIPIVINAGGELESSKGEMIVCEVEGSDLKIVEMLPEGTEVEGEVKNITEFGLFVGLEGDIDGMVHLRPLIRK